MDYNPAISELTPGREVEGFYILSEGKVRTTNAGKPFLSGTVADAGGRIDFVCWDYSGTLRDEDIGRVVKLRGLVGEYRGAAQLSVQRIRFATDTDDYDCSALVATAPIDAEQAWEDVRAFIESMQDADYRGLCEALLSRHEDAFRRIPAAKSVHHGFLSGLLMHTSNMLRTADYLAGLYAEVIDRDLLLTGTLLHDIAKEREFTFSALGLATDYTPEGDLLGHLYMGAQEAAQVAKELEIPEEKSMLVQHMILSHHGQPEFGAAVVPKCAESELLSYIDMIDSRMEIYAETFENVPRGSFSQRVFALDKRIYNHN